jgi:hypothetical protein
MGWLQRLFGQEKPANAQQVASGASTANSSGNANSDSVPPERVGLNGEYDQSGLAKRVALAFDQDPDLDDIETLYIAQTGSTVVLKGRAPSQDILSKMVNVAKKIDGATAVETDQVSIG